MAKINVVHVLVGGLLVGVVVNIWGMASVMLLSEVQRGPLNQPPGSGVPVAMALAYLIGIIAVWIYAFISTRYGRGLRSAAIAALGVWIAGYAIQAYVMRGSDQISGAVMAQRAGMSLAGFLLATAAGAWVYDRPIGRADATHHRGGMGLGHQVLVEAGALLGAYYIIVGLMIALDIGGVGSVARAREVDLGGAGVSIWPAARFSTTAAVHAVVAGALMLTTVWATIRAARRGAAGQTLWLGSLLVVAIGVVPVAVGLAWVFSRLGLAVLGVALLVVRAVSIARVRTAPS